MWNPHQCALPSESLQSVAQTRGSLPFKSLCAYSKTAGYTQETLTFYCIFMERLCQTGSFFTTASAISILSPEKIGGSKILEYPRVKL